MAVTAIVNQKGGVGKTTVTLGLAAVLSAAGRTVLVVDLDPQANATTGVGVWSPETTIAEVLTGEEPGSISQCVVGDVWGATSDDGPDRASRADESQIISGDGSDCRFVGRVDLAPSSPALARLEHELATDPIGGGDRLATVLGGVTDGYDHVLIDCPPSLGLLTVNALFASDDVVIVAEPAAWSVDGVAQIRRNVERVAARRGGSPAVRGIAVNKLARTRDSKHWDGQIRSENTGLVVGPPLRLRAAIAEASAQALPITAMVRSGSNEAVAELTALVEVLGFVEGDPQDGDTTNAGPAVSTEPMIDGHVASDRVVGTGSEVMGTTLGSAGN